MPQWITYLMLAIVAWFALSIVGGLLVGRSLRMAAQPSGRRRRETRL
jgi:hypothetical protein